MTVDELNAAYDLVYGVLGCTPRESLTQAARRALHAGTRPPLETLEVARRILPLAGHPPREQWQILLECAALVRRHDARKQRRHGRHGDDT